MSLCDCRRSGSCVTDPGVMGFAVLSDTDERVSLKFMNLEYRMEILLTLSICSHSPIQIMVWENVEGTLHI